MILFCR